MNAFDTQSASRTREFEGELDRLSSGREVSRAQELGTGWSVLALMVCGGVALATVGAFPADQEAANWTAGIIGGFFVVVALVWVRSLYALATPAFATWLLSFLGGLAGAVLVGIAYRPQASDGRPDDLALVAESLSGQVGVGLIAAAIVLALLMSLRHLTTTTSAR